MTTIEIINLIEANNVDRHKKPQEALKIEVIKMAQSMNITFANEIIEAELIELEKLGKIKIGRTLNDNYIKVLNNELYRTN